MLRRVTHKKTEQMFVFEDNQRLIVEKFDIEYGIANKQEMHFVFGYVNVLWEEYMKLNGGRKGTEN